jgi:hypothetical protein
MKAALLVMLALVGCASGDNRDDPAVVACHAQADRTCESVGFGSDQFCELVLRQDCSEADAAAARAVCMAHPEMAADRHGDECVLAWR